MAGRGLGTRLMLAIIDEARTKGLTQIIGLILSDNAKMLELMRGLGFKVGAAPDDPDFKVAVKDL